MAWQGLGDLVNHIRKEWLGLGPLTAASAPGTVVRLEIPYSYAWYAPESLPLYEADFSGHRPSFPNQKTGVPKSPFLVSISYP